MSREGALWIGGLEPYMDEEFLMSAMRQSGEENIISIKVKNISSWTFYVLNICWPHAICPRRSDPFI